MSYKIRKTSNKHSLVVYKNEIFHLSFEKQSNNHFLAIFTVKYYQKIFE